MFEQLFGSFDELKNNIFDNGLNTAVDILEVDNGYLVKVDMPGVLKNDVVVTFEGESLVIEGNIKQGDEEKFILRERSNHFKRELFLSEEVDHNSISAKLENGVLSILIAKKEKNIKKINIE